jgi:undecaprenyl diphosphate synthase
MEDHPMPNTLNHPPSGLHVAIIMDGSGRWATAHRLPRMEGHRAGRAAVNRTAIAADTQNIRTLTLFTFSTENWERPENEVTELMRTFEEFFRADCPALIAHGVRISALGRRDRLPESLREAIDSIEAASADRTGLHVRFAIDYSGRDAILAAASRFKESGPAASEEFARLLNSAESAYEPSPDIDLLIRTGGELRLSNCPLWEIAYAELYFTACMWPDFGAAEFDAALQDFYARERRFGRIPATVP